MELLIKKEKDFYQRTRSRIRSWLKSRDGRLSKAADVILAAPDLFHLIARLATDDSLPSSKKRTLLIALAYYISPIDLLPEAVIGPIGFIEDVVLGAFVLNEFLNDTDQSLVKKYWAGDWDILKFVENVVDRAHSLIGPFLWNRVKGVVSESDKHDGKKKIFH